MLPLDPKTFLVDTLKPYATGDKPGAPGLLERYLLEPADSDDAAIQARLADVKAIWDKSLEHPRYGEIAKFLANQHDDAELTLLDPTERSRLAAQARVTAEAEHREAQDALARWRDLLKEYVVNGGLTPNTRATLESIAQNKRLDSALVRAELDAAPVAAKPDVMPEKEREQVRRALEDLARVVGEERIALSLYHALGLSGITDDLTEVQRLYEQADAQNRARGFGQTATAYQTVLANVRVYLLDRDPRAYIEGLTVDIGTAIQFDAARATTDKVIDPTEAEALIQNAVSRGLTPELARRLLSDLARENGAVVQTGAIVDYVSCPACNTPHPRPSAPDKCKRCGVALFVVCPADDCATKNDATSVRCSSCGTDLHQYAEATRRLASLPDAIADGRIGWAATELQEITRVLGAGVISDDLRRNVESLAQAAESTWADVEAALAERRLYAARSLLRGLSSSAGDVLGSTGDRPAVRSQEVDRRLSEVNAALERARGARGADREAALVAVVELAADCEEAVNALAAIPPEPPGAVRATLGPAGAVVEWGKSTTGGARYRVRRVDVRTGESADLASSADTRIEDRDAPTGATVRYEVSTLRGKALSTPVRSESLLIAREVQAASATDGDGEVRLNWQAVPASARVVVQRKDERTGATKEIVADRTGLVDRDVDNGARYAYRIAVEYSGVDGAAEWTAGQTLYGQPAEPPEGITSLHIRTGANGVIVGFDRPANGAVSIIRCSEEPAISLGDSVDPGALASIGEVLRIDAEGARDSGSTGVCWYLPVTVAGGTAIAGTATRHLALAEIANVTAAGLPGQLRVTWEWPPDVRVAKVLWRRDRQPNGPDEPGTDSAWVRLGEYRDNGGFTIENTSPGSIFVAVVPGIRSDGDLVAGTSIPKGARAAMRSTDKSDLRYVVRKAGMRKKRLEIEVQVPEGVSPPSLVLVAKSGDLLPRTASEGDVLARFGGGQPLISTVDISARSRPLAVRLFLESTSSAQSFQVYDPGADDLVIH